MKIIISFIIVVTLCVAVDAAKRAGTSQVKHLEPVADFSLSSLHPRTKHYVPLARNERKRSDGLVQLYPDEISVEFTAFGVRHAYNLTVMHELFPPHSTYEVHGAFGEVLERVPNKLRSYWYRHDDGSFATLTIEDDLQGAHGIVQRNDELFQLDPFHRHKEDMDSATLQEFGTHHKMVVFRTDDMILDGANTRLCGANDLPTTDSAYVDKKIAHLKDANATTHLHVHAGARSLLTVQRWVNCFPNGDVARKLHVGVASDAGYYRIWGSSSAVDTAIAGIFANMNTVYLTQINVWLSRSQLLIKTATDGTNWNQDRVATACTDINTDLTYFNTWRASTYPTTNGIWHLMTDCYPPAGTVGLAYVGVLCNSNYGTGVSSHTGSSTWTIVAHEIGHNFGGNHAFQEGQGTTGGIMDYGDGKYLGEYQFHPVYNQAEMCAEISSSLSTTGTWCWQTYAAACGNAIIEQGEDCDDTSACCDQTTCLFKPGNTCSGANECCVSCQIQPSTTYCGGGLGYCRNGACSLTSACDYYSNTDFCGMETGGCVEKCSISGGSTCYSLTAFEPDIARGVPDGTICRLSPYSTCVAGVCTQSTSTTYSWQINAWSTCTPSCEGQQTRSVYCVSSTGQTVADSSCGTKPATQQSCGPVCPNYQWVAYGFSACSTNCGGGTQTQTVGCQDNNNPGILVAESNCNAGTKPATSQSCNTTPCPVRWVYGTWGTCTVPCGGGTQTRTVQCTQTKDGVDSVVASSVCTGQGLVPEASSQSCNSFACTTYEWYYTIWSECSVECGTGYRSRSVVCRDNNGNTVDNTNCAGTQPATSELCNTQLCPNYQYTTGEWGPCDVECGGGQQQRTLTCMDMNTNLPADPIFCTNGKPAEYQPCNTQACVDYHWEAAPYGECLAEDGITVVTCGGGTATRDVFCHDMATTPYTVVEDSYCIAKGEPVPPTSMPCNEQACDVFYWVTGDFGSCSVACGGGTQTRSVNCVLSGPETVATDEDCAAAGIKPDSSQACNTDACNTYDWSTGDWSGCSASCNTGLRTRTVTCVGSDGVEAEDSSLCTTPQPATEEVCNTELCPVFWFTSDWGECSKICESGYQTRIVECRDSVTLATVDETLCAGTKPSTEAVCNAFPCAAWIAGPWSNCSEPCDEGTQTRTVICETVEGVEVDGVYCVHSMPTTSQVCLVTPCPHWHRSDWSECSVPCGGGTQTRTLTCRLPHDSIYLGALADESLCPEYVFPATEQICNTDACTGYYYITTNYGECLDEDGEAVTCGGGTQTGTVSCVDDDGNVVDNSLCIGTTPDGTRECNTEPCAVFEWYVADETYGECSADCGGGVQYQTLVCRNAGTIQWEVVDDSYCEDLKKPTYSQRCNIEKELCGENGECSDGKCVCNAGYQGSACEIAPVVSDVTTDAAQYPSGVPAGERVTITWTADVGTDYVNVVLTKESWEFPMYIGIDVINIGKWIWDVPTLEPGKDYRVAVWFSESVQSTSELFAIADPCAYKSCGQYGVCDSAQAGICVCADGWTGVTCAVSPCITLACAEHSSCDNALGSAATCVCSDDYTGDTCATPTTCAAESCDNGVAVGQLALDGQSACECQCDGKWTGETCSTCTVECQNGFDANDDCTACNCGGFYQLTSAVGGGYYGQQCECTYYDITLRLYVYDSNFVNDPASLDLFIADFTNDIAWALGIGSDRVNVLSVTAADSKRVLTKFELLDECGTVSKMDLKMRPSARGSGEKHTAFTVQSISYMPSFSTEAALADTYSTLKTSISDPNSNLYRGIVTGGVDPTYGYVSDQPAIMQIVLIGLGVAFVVGLCAVGAVMCARRAKAKENAKSNMNSMSMANL